LTLFDQIGNADLDLPPNVINFSLAWRRAQFAADLLQFLLNFQDHAGDELAASVLTSEPFTREPGDVEAALNL
jgi:hypothetical protein